MHSESHRLRGLDCRRLLVHRSEKVGESEDAVRQKLETQNELLDKIVTRLERLADNQH